MRNWGAILFLPKLILVISTVLCFILTTLPFYPFYKKNPFEVKKILAKILHIHCAIICFFLNIKINAKNLELLGTNENYLFVGNHLSYLDIFVLSAVHPMSFITSFEMKEVLGIGLLCELAGTVFVERRSRSNREKELSDIENTLLKGGDVMLYAEATSTNGERVRTFRRPMFQPAIDHNTPVMTVVLNYTKINGEKVNIENRDRLFWYGKMPLFPHLVNMLLNISVEVEIEFLEVVETQSMETTKEISEKTHEIVSAHYIPITS